MYEVYFIGCGVELSAHHPPFGGNAYASWACHGLCNVILQSLLSAFTLRAPLIHVLHGAPLKALSNAKACLLHA